MFVERQTRYSVADVQVLCKYSMHAHRTTWHSTIMLASVIWLFKAHVLYQFWIVVLAIGREGCVSAQAAVPHGL